MNNSWKIVTAALALSAVGCSATDPCDGLTGTCVSAKVTGSVGNLDQLRINVKGFASKYTPSPANGTFTLPVKLALSLPASVGNQPVISVDGLLGGVVVASSTEDMFVLVAGQKQAHEFKLMAGPSSDGGVGDMIPPDFSGPLVITPTLLDFGNVPRGMTSAPKDMTVINHTTSVVTLSGQGADGGHDDNDFSSTFGSGCGKPDMSMNVTVAPGATCVISFTFSPSQLGPRRSDFGLTYSGGASGSVIVTQMGNGTATWTAESLPGGITPNLEVVAGGSSNDVYVVGHAPSVPAAAVWHSKGDGNWSKAGTTVFSLNLTALAIMPTVGGGEMVFIGGDPAVPDAGSGGAEIWASRDGTDNFKYQQVTAMGDITAIGAQGGTAFAVTNAGWVAQWDGSTTWNAIGSSSLTTRLTAITFAQGKLVVAGDGVFYQPSAAMPLQSAKPPNTNPTFLGIWAARDGTTWGTTTDGSIWRWDNITDLTTPPVSESTNGGVTLTGIAGRDLAGGGYDIWAVGTLGNKILHRNSAGIWDRVAVPTSAAMQSVWVADNGEVYTAGFNGQIGHLK